MNTLKKTNTPQWYTIVTPEGVVLGRLTGRYVRCLGRVMWTVSRVAEGGLPYGHTTCGSFAEAKGLALTLTMTT
jgi:hypothetical protein